MSWALFWFAAFCFVTTLIVLDNWERIRAWTGRFSSAPAKTSARASGGGADAFVRQAADAAGRARAASGIGRAGGKASGLDTSGPTWSTKALTWTSLRRGFGRNASNAASSIFGAAKTATLQARSPALTANASYSGRFLGEVGAFLWRAKWLILFVVGFVAIASTLGGMFDWGKSKDTIRAERDAAESEVAVKDIVIDRNGEIAEISSEVAALRAQIRVLSDRGQDEIAAATPENETPLDDGLVAAWRRSINRMCLYPDQNGHLPDPCGSGA